MKFFLCLIITFCSSALIAQQNFITRTGQIGFFSSTPLEDINATNNEVYANLNVSGELNFAVLIRGFHFRKALMEEHFNENYMESEKFPKAAFKGKIVSMPDFTLSRDESFSVTVAGDLTIHGVTQKVSIPATLIVKNGVLASSAKFKIKVKDYNIKIPSLVADKIAETIEITVNCRFESK